MPMMSRTAGRGQQDLEAMPDVIRLFLAGLGSLPMYDLKEGCV